ncbi:hypothetical protein PRZ48_013972 [Zasmidium cellare]|uniref:Heterokaryon incompatibility domain-containing protein n=1 Tax=Zasmidium cellare TaxID=395010 RepID=A0ABR0E040_ZASCE|nr:hypothetical protein PRZ48_013972 [Zasmidium cellare]
MPSQENGYHASPGHALENGEQQTRNQPRSRIIAVIEEFSLTWFTVSMNTGILSILMHENPYQFNGLYVLSTIMFVFNIVLFIAFFAILMFRIVLRPRRFVETLMGDLQELAMLGTIPIAWFTIAGQVGITVSNAGWGSHAFTIVAYVMWWIGTAVMLFVGVMVFAVLLKQSVTDTAHMSPALVIPFVGTSTNAVVGALIVTYSAEVSAGIAIPVIVVSYLILGVGFFVGIIVLTLLFIRIMEQGVPDAMTPALFMMIGPPGQSGAAMLLLGEASRMHFPGYMKGTALTEMGGTAFSSIGVLFGLVFVGLGVYFMMYGVEKSASVFFALVGNGLPGGDDQHGLDLVGEFYGLNGFQGAFEYLSDSAAPDLFCQLGVHVVVRVYWEDVALAAANEVKRYAGAGEISGNEASPEWRRPDTVYPGPPIDPDREIRVLQLLPGHFEDGIECSLKVRSIDCVDRCSSSSRDGITASLESDDSPQNTYYALSYAWGGSDETKYVSIQGAGVLPVTINLWRALRRLRSTTATRPLWADQLCINQGNTYERNHQISHMGCIYGHAARVLIWLGDARTTTNDRRATMKEQYHQLEEAIDRTFPSWWTRAWVVQEFMSARNGRVVCFGSCQVPYDEFNHMFRYRLFSRKVLGRSFKMEKIMGQFLLFKSLADDETTDLLIFRIWVSLLTDCKDPRDKVYSLLALMSEEERRFIKPDYNKSVAAVYAEVTYAWIAANKNLSILVLPSVMSWGSRQDFPSWALDFRLPRRDHLRLSPLENTNHGFIERQAAVPSDRFGLDVSQTRPWCKRQPEVQAKVVFDINQLTLTVKALRFDLVSSAFIIDSGSSLQWRLYNRSRPDRALSGTTEGKIRSKILHHISACSPYKRLGMTRTACKPPLIPENLVSQRMVSRFLGLWDKTVRQEAHPIITSCIGHFAASVFQGATFFMTRTGFLGAGPPGIQEGDSIVLPYGSRHPMALQENRDDGTFEFKGLTYIHGIMEGELLTRLPNTVFEEEDFILR